jgi:N-acetylneuraminic acid mutarotase
MRESVVLLLVLIVLAAFCVAVAPAFSSEPLKENSWVSKASMHVARSSLGVAVVNGRIYAIGGIADDSIVGVNEEYNPATDTWVFKKSMPTPRESFAIVSCQGKIYCIGGTTDVQSHSITGVTEVYDPVTDTWETKASLPNPRSGIKAHEVDGKIYLIGGYVLYWSNYNYYFSDLNDVYDPETDSWASGAPLPTAVPATLSVVVGGKIYFVMGLSNPHQIYDVENDSWSLAGVSMPAFSALHEVSCATAGVDAPERVYVVADTGTFVYDPINDEWVTGASILRHREGFSVAVVNDVIYAIGGFTASYQNYPDDWIYGPSVTVYSTVEQYTPFGYGTVPPTINVASPETNGTYVSGNVSLVFAVNKPVSWIGYSLDEQDNVTVSGNVTLSGLPSGLHNVTVYARDEFGNVGASETLSFTVAEVFPVVPVAAASAASVAVLAVGLLVYFRKRNHRSEAGLVKEL